MTATVHYPRVLRHAFDVDSAMRALEEAFAGSYIRVTKRTPTTEPNRLPDWVAVDFSAEDGDYFRLRADALRRLQETGLADEFKPEAPSQSC